MVYQQSDALESVKAGDKVPSEIRRETRDKINSIMDYMASMAKANPGVYGSLYAKLLEMVGLLNQKIRVRKPTAKTATSVTPQTT